MRLFVLYIILACSTQLFAQVKSNDNELALLYYSKGEYEKAASLYETMYKQTHSQIHFDYLIQCYININTIDKAIAVTQEQIKFYPKTFYYQVKLGVLYEQQNKIPEAQSIYQKVIKKSSKQENDCLEAADACIENKKYDIAQQILEHGFDKFPDNILIYKKLLTLYSKLGENQKLVSAYLELLESNPNELEYIEQQLQVLLYENQNLKLQELFQTQLLSKLDENSNNTELNELLIWFYVQQKSFKKAFTSARALDLRLKEEGDRVIEIGNIAMSNLEYATASDCFSYVVSKGRDNRFYTAAIKFLLEATNKKLFESIKPDITQIQNLEKQYYDVLKEIGMNENSVDVMRNLAHIQAFYLNKTDYAIALLKDALLIQSIDFEEKGLCSMELADIYLFTDDIWEANLLYAKIALDYKNNDVGHQARFKQAQIAYYNGQFDYAQALLDILKASTTKLISNNAFELAQLISENTALDTSTQALQYFAKADLLVFQNKDSLAFVYLDSVISKFPGHSLEDDIYLRKAIITKKQNDTAAMVNYLTEIVQRFSYDVYADNAHFMLAEYYDFVAKNEALAQLHYKTVIVDYPNSYYSTIARKRYREIEKL